MENDNVVGLPVKAEKTPTVLDKRLANLKKGHKRGPSKVTHTIKEAVLLAANNVGDILYAQGEEGTGMKLANKGLVGYLEAVAMTDMKAFTGLMAKIMPVQIQAEVTINEGLADRLKRARERVIDVERAA